MENMGSMEEILKKTRELKDLLETETNPYDLFDAHATLGQYLNEWTLAAKVLTATGANDKAEHVAFEIGNCMAIFKRSYVKAMEILLDEIEKGYFEKNMKSSIDSFLKKDPARKQFLLDEHKQDIDNFNAMWTLYNDIKKERHERASDHHKALMERVNKNILEYISNKNV